MRELAPIPLTPIPPKLEAVLLLKVGRAQFAHGQQALMEDERNEKSDS